MSAEHSLRRYLVRDAREAETERAAGLLAKPNRADKAAG